MRTPGPPRLFEWAARLAAGRHRWEDAVGGDLCEEYAEIVAREGTPSANRWYRRQVRDLCADRAADAMQAIGRVVAAPFTRRGDSPMRAFLSELRPAFRSLRKQPLSTVAIILTLSVGLGSNAAVFGMVDALALRPFTFEGVDDLMFFSEQTDDFPYPQETVSPANFGDWRRQATSFTALAAFSEADVNLTGGEQADRVGAAIVSGEFFTLLGITPAAGRLLTMADEPEGSDQQVVLADGLWRRRFGGDPGILGRTLQLDGVPHTVVGIAPPGFDFPLGVELWTPLGFDADDWANRRSQNLNVAGRLKPGVSFDAAAAEMATIYDRIRADHPDEMRDRFLVSRTFTAGMIDFGLPRVLGLWQAAALFLLVIGCANAANLLLARSADRRRELALRTALGASRWRVMRHLLVESLLLALLSAPMALVVAGVTVGIVRGAMPAELIRYVTGWMNMGVDLRLAGVTVIAAMVTALLIGLLPALQATSFGVVKSLRDGSRSVSSGRHRLRRGLVVAQIALALPLLLASGMSALGARQLASGPQGYDPDGLLSLRLVMPARDYPDAVARRTFTRQLLEEAAGIPGVNGVAASTALPSGQNNSSRELVIDGRPVDPGQSLPRVDYRAVSADYHEVMRLPVFEGRGLSVADRDGAEPVALVSRSLADRFFPGASALGQRVRLGETSTTWITIVGVTGDVIHDWFSSRDQPTIYVPIDQNPGSQVSLVMRTAGDPLTLADPARRLVATIDQDLAPFQVMTMREAVRIRTTGIRFIGGMMAAFGGIALLLATVGIYSVMSYFVSERRQEIGIRMALGASRRSVLTHTVVRGTWMTGLGLAVGLVLGVLLGRLIENALFGVVALEPWLVAGISGALGAVAVVASLIPARQAAHVDPVIAMRAE